MGATTYPVPGTIKSIQRGTTSASVTISAVNTAKSRLVVNGWASSAANAENASLTLSGSTSLTYNKGGLGGSPVVAWELTEFF